MKVKLNVNFDIQLKINLKAYHKNFFLRILRTTLNSQWSKINLKSQQPVSFQISLKFSNKFQNKCLKITNSTTSLAPK